MQWIVEGFARPICRKDQETRRALPLERERPPWNEPEAGLLLLLGGSLRPVGGVVGLRSLCQDGLHLSGIGAVGGQLEVHLISFRAPRRQNDLPRLGVDGGLLDETLAFE